ncbi:MAG: hypothetical protein PHQ64_01090 [Bacilli bacterium]|nr:hypothetical protein [Bacilli bacterium]
MNIDLTKLNSGLVTTINIEEIVDFSSKLEESNEILDLVDVNVKVAITKNSTNENVLNATIKGNMILEDAINLEELSYPFETSIIDEILEKLENNENSIDILEVLWQNIILEVPLKFTKVKDLSEFHGNGWKLVSEDDLKEINNPFKDLKHLIGEE